MNKGNNFGPGAIAKSIGLPVVTDGYAIDYVVDGAWKHVAGVVIFNGAHEHCSDIEFVQNIIDSRTTDGVTHQNVSHISRIFDYDGSPDQLMKACEDLTLLTELLKNHKYKIIIVNKNLFDKFNEEE